MWEGGGWRGDSEKLEPQSRNTKLVFEILIIFVMEDTDKTRHKADHARVLA